jgi:PhzF family phenazine biosynthesis protein
MQIHELKCFGERSGTGNAALVIEGDDAPEAVRRDFARARATTCVYLDPARDGAAAAATLDYYYPHTRSPLCPHATLAAAQVLFARSGPDAPIAPVPVTTAMHGQRLELSRAGADVFVRLARQAVPALDLAPGLAARLLAAPGIVLASAPRLASVGSAKLLIEVADVATLDALHPDLALITEWSQAHGVNGCYVYCRLGAGEYAGRNFNHLDPALEDSATGVAAGALTALLGHGIVLRQGRATGRACLIRTGLDGDAILVGGRAELA